jgi:paraquat-inducible protein A
MAQRTAMAEHLVTCHDCHKLLHLADGHDHGARCPRCHGALHFRKPDSLQRTWALLLAAVVLYVPANVYPIMRVTSLGRTQADTILSGVVHLFEHGMWPLALIVFFASIVVPMAKLFALVHLLVSVQRRSPKKPVERTKLYRLTEMFGRWSMVDIYVVAMLAALVQLGSLAQVEAELGAVFFGATVVTTMIAAESFDPRLIWDRRGRPKHSEEHSKTHG